jgi:hypothetical protein
MDYQYRFPGMSSPVVTIRPSVFDAAVSADGVKLRGRGTFRKTYTVPMPDGSAREMQLNTGAGGLRVRAGGVDRPVGPQSSTGETVVAMLPIALVVSGGLLGGLIGGVAVGLNLSLARGGESKPVRVGTMLLTSVIAAVVWWIALQLIRGAL